jgi:hypothetical protein
MTSSQVICVLNLKDSVNGYGNVDVLNRFHAGSRSYGTTRTFTDELLHVCMSKVLPLQMVPEARIS